ncbi:hypothetical protein KY345_00560 [Candidatus Woesearchaeota archaeon]|nr:hypothetical protein [Candidatus Woesearchaeota archaeon]
MMICRKCKGKRIKSRRNYSHGKKSKPITTMTCKDCGSFDIDTKSGRWGGRRKRWQTTR